MTQCVEIPFQEQFNQLIPCYKVEDDKFLEVSFKVCSSKGLNSFSSNLNMRLSIPAKRKTLLHSWSVTLLEGTAIDKCIILQVRLHAYLCIVRLGLQ